MYILFGFSGVEHAFADLITKLLKDKAYPILMLSYTHSGFKHAMSLSIAYLNLSLNGPFSKATTTRTFVPSRGPINVYKKQA